MTTEFKSGNKHPDASKKARRSSHQTGAARIRREDAASRNEIWGGLSPASQLAELDKRLGKGQGAKRQRARIAALAAKQASTPAVTANPAKH